jgi:hypothetical protein
MRSGAVHPEEDPMRELTYAEIQEISGGVPPGSSLDEASYRLPAEQLLDPVDYERTVAQGTSRNWSA